MKKTLSIFSLLVLLLLPLPMATFAQAQTVECAEEYVVQAGDWLSKIAEKEFSDPLAYPALVVLANTLSDDDYTNIENPNIIEPGWTICIPSEEALSDLLADADPAIQAMARSAGIYVPPTFEDTLWVLVASGDALNPDVIEPQTVVTARFASDGSVAGSGGCNNYNASYEVGADNSLSVGPVAGTRKACPTGMEQEQAYFTALSSAQSYEISSDGLLKITFDAGTSFEQALFFVDGQAELQSTQWVLQAYGNPDNLQQAEAGTSVTAVFTGPSDSNKGSLIGFGGCNNYSANYSISGSDKITINNPASSLQICPVGSEQEAEYLSLLQSAQNYEIVGKQLTISTRNEVIIFTAANLPLENVLWTLESYGPPGLQTLAPENIEITAFFDEDKVNGSAGCNNYSAGYETIGRQLSIDPAATTRMLCQEGAAVEQAFLSAMQSVESYQTLGDQLRLKYNNGQNVLTFRANRTDLEGTYWELVSYGAITDPNSPAQGSSFNAVFTTHPDAPSGLVAGSTGCNEYSAPYVADLTNIKVNLPFKTQEFCGDGVAEMEQAFFLGLNNATEYRIVGNALQIVYNEGRQALNFVVFQPASQPPTAVIDGPSEVQVGELFDLDGSASSGPNAITQYHWDLGDGTQLNTAVVRHAYSEPGAYHVTLTVVDGEGLSSTTHKQITANSAPQTAPTAVIDGPTQGVAGDPLTYSGVNSVPGSSAITVYAWSVSVPQPLSNASDDDITITFDQPGVYVVGLSVTDENGLSDNAALQVEIFPKEQPQTPPTAVIDGPTQAEIGQQLNFSAQNSFPGSSAIVAYNWDLGNGTSGSGVDISTAYNAPGIYGVVLTVVDENGLSNSAQHRIEIFEPQQPQTPPTAIISGPAQGTVNQPLNFSASASTPGSSAIVAYAWDFGNGTTSDQVEATTVYNAPDPYSVGLTVVDENGLSSNAVAQISINPDLAGAVWVLDGPTPITIEFNGGAVSGSSGCNTYSGSYTTNGNNISISVPIVTQLACEEELMAQENAYLQALQQVQSYQIQGNVLTLSYPGGVLTYRLEGTPQPR